MKIVHAAIVLCCLAPALAAAQTAPAPAPQTAAPQTDKPVQGPTFSSGVELVMVDVTVLDDRGRPLTDLQTSDFSVTIDGQPRRVVTSEFVHVNMDPKKPGASPTGTIFSNRAGELPGQQIVFAVDQSNIRAGSARAVLGAATAFLQRLSSQDSVAFVTFPPPGPIVDFTTEHRLIRDAMLKVTGTDQTTMSQMNIGVTEAVAIIERRDEMRLREVVRRECGASNADPDELENC